jgi:hypothetical protein
MCSESISTRCVTHLDDITDELDQSLQQFNPICIGYECHRCRSLSKRRFYARGMTTTGNEEYAMKQLEEQLVNSTRIDSEEYSLGEV